MGKHKHNNDEITKSGIDLQELVKIEELEHLRDTCKYLLQSPNPSITVQADGKKVELSGHDARTLGLGMQMVLMEIGYQAYDPWMEN